MADSPRALWQMQDASGNPQDSSGNALHMTGVTGTPDYQQAGPMSDFSINCAATEHLDRSSVASTATNNFTMELWIFPTSIASNGRIVFSNGGASDNRWGILMDTNGTFAYMSNTNTTATRSSNACPLNTWSHIVVRRKDLGGGSSQWRYLFNGALDGAAPSDVAPTSIAGTVQVNAGASLAARYAYVAVYETALSDARILAHYQAAAGQVLLPDADNATGGWTTAPLFSKLNDSSDATVITATAS